MFLQNLLGNSKIHKEMQKAKNNGDYVKELQRGGIHHLLRRPEEGGGAQRRESMGGKGTQTNSIKKRVQYKQKDSQTN